MTPLHDYKDPLSPRARALNTRAFSALIGWERDWQAALMALLRSDAPISPAVRKMMCEAIEGTSTLGLRLTLSGHERSARWWASIQDRREWRAFGPKVDPFVKRAANLPEGLEQAAESLDSTESYCKKSYYYWRDCNEWMHSARNESTCYRAMSDALLSLEFHISSIEQKTLKPQPTSGAKFDREFATQLRSLSHLADLLGAQDDLRDGLVSYLYWLERVQYPEA